jgi:uncharacterized protein (UPF0335 family)
MMQLEERQALIGFITEIEASRERAKGETRHQSEIFKKAREKHLDPKAMRKVLQRRAMSKADRENLDETIDLYEHALGSLAKAKEAVEGGMSRREAAEKFSVPRAALGHVARGSKNEISDPPHDPETGVIEGGAPSPESRVDEIAPSSAEAEAPCAVDSTTADIGKDDVVSSSTAVFDPSVPFTPTVSVGAEARSAEPVPNPDGDDLAFPDFLDARRRSQVPA